jgi:hypothetical protein
MYSSRSSVFLATVSVRPIVVIEMVLLCRLSFQQLQSNNHTDNHES